MHARVLVLLLVPLCGCPRTSAPREGHDAPVAPATSTAALSASAKANGAPARATEAVTIATSSATIASPAPIASTIDTNALLAAKLRDGHLERDLVDVTLDDFVLALAKPGTKVVGLGPWSKRLRISTREARKWSTVQLLWDAHNRYGTFFFGANEEAIVVWPESRGEPLLLDDENITVRLLTDHHTIQASDSTGAVLWNANVIETFRDGLDPGIDGPSPRVRSFSYDETGRRIDVVFGRHSYAWIDLRTGRPTYFGSD
jgi:hypothetical protein